MGTPEQWVEVFASGTLFGVVMFVFVGFPKGKRNFPFPIVFWKSAVLALASFGFGMIETFSSHAVFHSGLRWVFGTSVFGAIVSGIVLRLIARRLKEPHLAPTTR